MPRMKRDDWIIGTVFNLRKSTAHPSPEVLLPECPLPPRGGGPLGGRRRQAEFSGGVARGHGGVPFGDHGDGADHRTREADEAEGGVVAQPDLEESMGRERQGRGGKGGEGGWRLEDPEVTVKALAAVRRDPASLTCLYSERGKAPYVLRSPGVVMSTARRTSSSEKKEKSRRNPVHSTTTSTPSITCSATSPRFV